MGFARVKNASPWAEFSSPFGSDEGPSGTLLNLAPFNLGYTLMPLRGADRAPIVLVLRRNHQPESIRIPP